MSNILRAALYLSLAAFLIFAGYLYYQIRTVSEDNFLDSAFNGEIAVNFAATEDATSEAGTTQTLNNAIEKFNEENFNEALELFLEISDSNKRGMAGVGFSYVKLEDYENGVTHLEKAISVGEDNFMVRKFLSFAYYMINDLEMSVINAESALAIKEEPDFRKFYRKVMRAKQSQENFVNEEALHFKVIYNGYVHSDISRSILDILEEAYDDIGGRIMYFPDASITVILYSEKDFSEVTMLPAWVMGSYDGKIKLPIKDIQKQNEEYLRTVLSHEYVHALIHSITPEIPVWINEGLAEYLAPRGLERVNQVIPLKHLEKNFPLDDKNMASIAYRESFSAVSHLVEQYGIHMVRDLLLSLGQGKPLNEAFEYAFFITYDEFVSKWGKEGS
jgi:tetratricopeptide (TPR) repeat protein